MGYWLQRPFPSSVKLHITLVDGFWGALNGQTLLLLGQTVLSQNRLNTVMCRNAIHYRISPFPAARSLLVYYT